MINVTRPIVPDMEVFSRYLVRVFECARFSNAGPLVEELELALTRITKANYLHLVSNGTVAIELALQAGRIKGEVITTPFTFCASSNSIERAGATPVFVDILPDELTIDPDAIEAAIGPDTEAILAVHVYGHHCRMNQIQQIAEKNGLFVVYDAAHAFDTHYDDTPLSLYGDATTYSFHATKLFHTGEGGAIETKHSDLSQRIQLLRNFGIAGEGVHLECGTNAKMPELSAAVGLSLLESYRTEKVRRKELSNYYTHRLAGIKGIRCDQRFSLSGYYFIIRVEGGASVRDELQARLANKGYSARRYFWPLTSSMPLSKKIIAPGGLSVAQSATDSVLALPFYGCLDRERVDEICRIIGDFMGWLK